ncbi:MAG: hypothetical protein M3198_06740 [Actinomycetota bacterium]|nr:hypothetical protein [Actinomycetota bacterium]
MGAQLQYAKIIDREKFMTKGGRVHPGLPSEVQLLDEPGKAAVFLVLRAWGDDHGALTEQWRIESPGGATVYESAPRELHLATPQHVEKLEDEIADLEFQFASDDYAVVFTVDEMEVARVQFPVVFNDNGNA